VSNELERICKKAVLTQFEPLTRHLLGGLEDSHGTSHLEWLILAPRFPLPSNNKGIHIQTHRLTEGFMKYAVEMGSGAIIYIPHFLKTGSRIQKLIGKIHRHTDSKMIS
jgi:hypothetical protein